MPEDVPHALEAGLVDRIARVEADNPGDPAHQTNSSIPSCRDEPERARRRRFSYDHGVGIRYWKRRYGGRVHGISERWVAEGHFGSFSVPGYRQAASKSEEMALNFDLQEIGRRFGIEEFV